LIQIVQVAWEKRECQVAGRYGHVGRGASACSTRRTLTRPRRTAAPRRNASSYHPGAAAKARRVRIRAAFLGPSVLVFGSHTHPGMGLWRDPSSVARSLGGAALVWALRLPLQHRSSAALARVTGLATSMAPKRRNGPTPPTNHQPQTSRVSSPLLCSTQLRCSWCFF
jgi:hypothetical protein